MPQNPLGAYVATNPSNKLVPLGVDSVGSLKTTVVSSADVPTNSALNITTATLVKAGAGRIYGFSVNTGGSSAGAVYDIGATSLTGAANLVVNTPTVAGIQNVNAPFTNGLVVSPGTSQVIAVFYA
jgi:hypothetical protein